MDALDETVERRPPIGVVGNAAKPAIEDAAGRDIRAVSVELSVVGSARVVSVAAA